LTDVDATRCILGCRGYYILCSWIMEFIWLLTRSLCCLWANVKAGKRAWQKKGLIMLQLLLLLPQIFEQLCWELLLCLFNFYHLYYDKTYLKQAVCWLLFNAYAAWLYNILLFWLFRTTTTLNWAGTTCLSELSKTICWNCLRTLIIIIAHDIMHMSKKRTNPNSR
jgi:hypothetical protein